MSPIEEARKILSNNIYMTLGTCSKDNIPWVSPLFVAYDDKYNFYWGSPKNSAHSKNIRNNRVVSFVCFDSNAPKWEGMGVYMSGEAFELSDEIEIKTGLKLIFKRLGEESPSVSDFIGDMAYRVYKFAPNKVWLTGWQEENGERVDGRVEVDLGVVS